MGSDKAVEDDDCEHGDAIFDKGSRAVRWLREDSRRVFDSVGFHGDILGERLCKRLVRSYCLTDK